MPNYLIISAKHAKGFSLDHLSAEALIMVPRPTVDPNIDYSDPIVAHKRKSLEYDMEPGGCTCVIQYMDSVVMKTWSVIPAMSLTTTVVRNTLQQSTVSASNVRLSMSAWETKIGTTSLRGTTPSEEKTLKTLRLMLSAFCHSKVSQLASVMAGLLLMHTRANI